MRPSVPDMGQDKAERIILEIVRQAGGTLVGKTKLFKAFYWAHRFYFDDERAHGTLSKWPIVRMPKGPGIDRCDDLLAALRAKEFLRIEMCPRGKHEAFRFVLSPADGVPRLEDPIEVEAVKRAVGMVAGKSARGVSEASHDKSASWRRAKDGDELDIYADGLGEDEVERIKATVKEAEARFEEALGLR
jgi:hypothetical protein